MKEIIKDLKELSDQSYQKFQSSLLPNINSKTIVGVRIPKLRKYAKGFLQSETFFKELPHKYYEENILHALLINEISDYDKTIKELNKFLPYVDNWAVCDILSPKVFKKHLEELLPQIITWTKSKKVYTARFGIGMLMRYYLDDNFKKEYLDIPLNAEGDDYYLKMMKAWFYATALAKRWDETIVYLEKNYLNTWVHNKTIQKGIESYRISEAQKEYLKSLKRYNRDVVKEIKNEIRL